MENVTEIKTSRIKSFVQKHKVAITVVATSTVWIAIQSRAMRAHNEFYTPEDDE